MTEAEASKWNERYSSGDYQPRSEPSELVERALRYLTPGRALVLACGTGRNALRLAEAGFDVEGVDVSAVAIDIAREEAIERGLDVSWVVAGIEEMDLPQGAYDLITMIRYTNREIWPHLVTALAPDGWLLLEQHLETERDVIGPGSEFRVAPGELLDAFSGLRIIEYFEAFQPSHRSGGGMTATTGLLACKGDPGW